MTMTSQVATEQAEHYVYCRDNGHTKFLEKAKKCENFFAGIQWDEEDLAKLRRTRRPALTMNKVLPSMASIFGEQIENRAEIGFRPSKNGNQETADALSKVWIQIQNNTQLTWKESAVFDDGSITSRGFFDVRLGFNDSVFGEVKIESLNPNNVVLDPDAEEYDPDYWKELFISKWFSLDDIELTWGAAAKKELEHKTKSNYMYGYDFIDTRPDTFGGSRRRTADDANAAHRRRIRILERQYKKVEQREHFVDLVTGDTRIIPKDMDREKIRLIMQAFNLGTISRPTDAYWWTVTADDVVLHHERSPYKHFTVVPYFPFFRRGNTIGLVENMIGPQELYNKSSSQELHVINTTANSGWKIKTGSLQNMDIEEVEERGAETGLVMELDDINNADKITANAIPTGLERVAFKAAEDLKEISMSSDSMRGFDRADVAAKAIMAKQVRGSVNFAKPLANLGFTQFLLARNTTDIVQEYYTEERLMRITGSDLNAESEEFTVNQMTPEGRIANDLTLGEYELTITQVPPRNTFEESQFDEAMRMREQGIPIPDDVIVENSHLARKGEVVKRIKDKMGDGEPSPEQQELQRLEVELKRLEADKIRAENSHKQSETALNLVRAQETAEGEGRSGGGDNAKLLEARTERERVVAEMRLQKYKIDGELDIKREELNLAREKMQAELLLKKATEAQKLLVLKSQESKPAEKRGE